jgi:hypothetical protein
MSSNENVSLIGQRSGERKTRAFAGGSKPSDRSTLALSSLAVAFAIVVLTWATLYQIGRALNEAWPGSWSVYAPLVSFSFGIERVQ